MESMAWKFGKGLRQTADAVKQTKSAVKHTLDKDKVKVFDRIDEMSDKESDRWHDGEEESSDVGTTVNPDVPQPGVDGEGDANRAVRISMADNTITYWAIHQWQRSEHALIIMSRVLSRNMTKEGGNPIVVRIGSKDNAPAYVVLDFIDVKDQQRVLLKAVLTVVPHENTKPVEKMGTDDLFVSYNPYMSGDYKGDWPWPIEDVSKWKYAPAGYRGVGKNNGGTNDD